MKKLISIAVILVFSNIAHSGIGKSSLGGDTSFDENRLASGGGGGGFVEPDPIFDLSPFELNGVSRLSPTLVINGTTLELVVSCTTGSQIIGTVPCDVGGTFTEIGTGTSPTTSTLVPFTDGSSAGVFTSAQKRVQAANNTIADFPTDDFVIETIYYDTVNNLPIIAKDSSLSSTTPGWQLRAESGGTVLGVSDGTTYTSASSNQVISGWNHIMAFHDNTGYLLVVANGSAGTPVAVSARGSLTTTVPFSIGGNNAGVITGKIAMVRVWKCTDCLLSNDDNTLVAKRRNNTLWGVIPSVAGDDLGTVSSTGETYTAIGDSSGENKALYKTTAALPKFTKGKFYQGSDIITGVYQHGASSSNKALQNITLDNASWVKLNSTVTANNTLSPTGDLDAETLNDDATAGIHCITQDMLLTAVPWTISVYADNGSLDFLYIDVSTLANVSAYYNVNTGTVGTVGSSSTAFVDPFYINLPIRAELRFTGTAATHTIRFCTASSDGVNSYSGGSGNIELWGVQVQGYQQATPLIVATTSAQVIGNSGSIVFPATSNVTTPIGSTKVDLYCPNTGTVTSGKISDMGLAGTLSVGFSSGTSSINYDGSDATSIWSTADTTDLFDGSPHSVFQVYSDLKTWAGVDSAITMTQFIDRALPALSTSTIGIGNAKLGGTSPGCIITRYRTYDSILTDNPIRLGVIGGSNSTDSFATSYGTQIKTNNGYLMLNASTFSATVADAYNIQWLTQVEPRDVQVVLVMTGLTDVMTRTAAAIHADVAFLAGEIIASGAKVITLDLTPRGAGQKTVTQDLNTLNEAAADGVNWFHVGGLYEAVEDGGATGALNAIYDSGDALHMNQAAHNLLTTMIEPTVLSVVSGL